ncbi:MarR family winged helix-turn-helix transcriptional regulator [Clostridium minihomine]|uniref:MarR family winged helix-turn-helix transcriptional regulator n=1 Tax=Clostridium minihomine TaxID=2045012 RepID=UPI001FB219A9|nr:MarR family transcriptional regulator [Clostridium minihomine]
MDSNTDYPNKNEFYRLATEINELFYSMDARFISEHQSLCNEDLSPKQMVLMDFVKKETQLSISQLAELMNVTSSAVSQIVTKLEKEKYLLRTINPNNRREIIVQLDQRGHNYYAKEEKINKEIIDRFYARMELDEIRQLRDILKKLMHAMDEDRDENKSHSKTENHP